MRTELVTTLKRQATELLSDIERDRQPILITQHGLPSAYLVDVETFELLQQRMAVLEGIARGEMAVAEGRVVSHAEAKTRMARWLPRVKCRHERSRASRSAPPAAPPAPVIKVRGELLTELPQDLYIPPDALEVFLDAFEGPLDLLLYLIRRQNLDVLDIPMAALTKQYMAYVEAARATRLELAAEYLLMAAMLIDIKSRMLLPRREQAEEASEGDDPRAELVRRLLEYEQMKLAGQHLDAMPQAGRDFDTVSVFLPAAARRLPSLHPEELAAAWLAILSRAKNRTHHRIGRQELSIREHMSRILKRLTPGEFVEFKDCSRKPRPCTNWWSPSSRCWN
jgi:segregation and condensation protein A